VYVQAAMRRGSEELLVSESAVSRPPLPPADSVDATRSPPGRTRVGGGSETRHRAPGARDHLQRLGLREGQADALLGQVFAASRAEPGGDA